MAEFCRGRLTRRAPGYMNLVCCAGGQGGSRRRERRGLELCSVNTFIRTTGGRRGLTFVEVMVVLIIISTLSTIGVLMYRDTRNAMRMREGALMLKQAFDTARSYAIRRDTPYAVVLNLNADTFWIDEYLVDTSGPTPQFVKNKAKVTPAKSLPSFIHFQDVSVLHVSDLQVSSGASEAFAQPHAPTDEVTIFFSPGGTSDYAVIQILQERVNATQSENYTSIRLYSSTGVAEIFERQRL